MSASRVLFIFIVFALVVAGLLMVVSNMTAQPIGNGTYNAYAGYNGNGTVANLVGSVGTVTVDGTNSMWTNSLVLNVGCEGTGTLNITNGGYVANRQGTIGQNTGSNGTVTVDGAIITADGPQSAKKFAEALVQALSAPAAK